MPTKCTAPTYIYVTPTTSETGVELHWSGAVGGTDNSVKGYDIQYSESSNNSTWGAWSDLNSFDTWMTEGWIGVMPSNTRGYYRRYRMRVRGSAGSAYYSDWSVASNSVRRNLAPNKPTKVTASPTVYESEDVTITWSGASSPTSTIKGYQVARRTSRDNEQTWSSWIVEGNAWVSSSSGSMTVTPMREIGIAVQYGVWTIDQFNVYSSEAISNSVYCMYSPCIAPTTFAVSSTIAEGNVTLSWSGATSGAGNKINSYEIEYSESSDGTTWGDWVPLTIITSTVSYGSLTVSPPMNRGDYRRFRIRVRGSLGDRYYSQWAIASNTLRKNVLPQPPSVFTLSPLIYIEPSVTLTWSGVVKGTSNIKNYVIQQSTSTDGINWSDWSTVTTVTTSLTYGTYTATPTNADNVFTRYRIAVTDSLNAVSSYVVSESIRKHRPPLAPMVNADRITYNTKPLVLIQTQDEPDGQPQTIYLRLPDGKWLNGEPSVAGVKTIFTLPELPVGTYTVTVEVRDVYLTSESVSCTFTILSSPFETISANVTHVKAVHINSLRTAVNNIRQYYGLHSYAWKDEIISKRTQIRDWIFHIQELRSAIDEVVALLHEYGSTFTIDWLPLTSGRPKADVMNQLSNIITGGNI